MDVYKNLFSNGSKINASEIAVKIDTVATTVDVELQRQEDSKFWGSPEQYGAVGSGDDTAVIQACLDANITTILQPREYVITHTLKLPRNHSLQGNGARIKGSATWTNHAFGTDVPLTTLLYVEGREAIAGTELDIATHYVRDLRLQGTWAKDHVGMFLGNNNHAIITQASNVNYSVTNYVIDNINVSYCYNAIWAQDVWATTFSNINTSLIKNIGLLIQGQCVNDVFVACKFSTGEGAYSGQYAMYVDGATYNSVVRRPEGISFIGGFYGYAPIGIRIVRALAFHFDGCIIDLNTNYAVLMQDASYITFDGCWMHSSIQPVFALEGFGTSANNTEVSLTGCKIFPTGTNDAVYIGTRQSGVIINGCYWRNRITFDTLTRGLVVNNICWDASNVGARFNNAADSIVVKANNYYKLDMVAVAT